MRRCPSDLKLELHLATQGSPAVAEHVAQCDGCRERVAAMLQIGDEFQRYVYPATIEVIRAAAEPPEAEPPPAAQHVADICAAPAA